MARPRSDIEPRIVQAAHSRFLKDGVDNASLRSIARDAGSNLGMVYYYFPSKEDLFMAVVEEAYEGLLAKLQVALDPGLPVPDRLLALFESIGKLDQYEIEVLLIVLRELLTSPERRALLFERFRRGHLPLVIRMVHDGVASGVMSPELHPMLLMTCSIALGAVPQLVLQVGREHLPVAGAPQGRALAEALVGVLLRGLAPLPKTPEGGEERSDG